MESGSNDNSSSSCSNMSMIAYGDNRNGLLCPTITTSLMSSSHQHHHTNDSSSSPYFLPHTNTNRSINTNPSGGSSSMIIGHHHNHNNNSVTSTGYFMEANNMNCGRGDNSNNPSSASVKAKIMAHPHYHRLLAAYVNCQKVGAPQDVVARLEEACAAVARMGPTNPTGCLGEDPALDQFMEAYCEMLTKYEQELSKPFKEAMLFLQMVETQFKSLSVSSSSSASGEAIDRNGSSEEETDVNNLIDPQAEDRELKGQLLRKYSGYLGSLKQEFMKKRKKGKLPKEARQQLLDWWSRHYKWPYPSESQKLALAESTGLDQKQINNWFINQRKRHWKPSEDMQFVVMDATHPHHYYMENVLGNPFPMDISPAML